MTVFTSGLLLGLGLIVAIGAQNAFVLRQGLQRQHVLATAVVCTGCDAALIALGVGGVGAVIAANQWLTLAATYGGAIFLLGFAAHSFWSAWRGSTAVQADDLDTAATLTDRRAVVLAALGFSLLNPHVYLDTVVLLGGLGAQYPPDERWLFAAGAMSGSAVWFFGLAYGAARLAPLFQRPWAWRVLDAAIGVVMVVIGLSLIW